MNFLSHFYFDRHTTNPEQVIGMVLPDLLKNANKAWSIRPEKYEKEYIDINVQNLYTGWKRHIEVDKYFHCSAFFLHHTTNIRTAIEPFLVNSPARSFFVAHIALELMLDSLLITELSFNTATFYSHLKNTNQVAIRRFLEINSLNNSEVFFSFLEEFINAEYLNSYRNPNEIVYALNRICMRIWDNPFDEFQKKQLTAILIDYQERLKKDFIEIFNEINVRLA